MKNWIFAAPRRQKNLRHGMIMHFSKVLCFAGGMALAASSASATTVSNTIVLANGGGGTPGCGQFNVIAPTSSATTASAQTGATGTGCTTQLRSFAGGGVVGVSGRLSAGAGSRSNMSVTASAVSTMMDIFLVPASGQTVQSLLEQFGDTISLTLNARLEGEFDVSVDNGSPFSRSAGVALDSTVRLFTSSGMQVDYDPSSLAVTNGQGGGSPLFRNISLTGTHNWQQAFSVSFSLAGRAGTSNGGDTNTFAMFDVFNSLSFVTDGPVFDVPDGFTVFAPELNIIDNRWTDPRVTTAPIPLPAGLPLLLAGLGALAVVRRKRI